METSPLTTESWTVPPVWASVDVTPGRTRSCPDLGKKVLVGPFADLTKDEAFFQFCQ